MRTADVEAPFCFHPVPWAGMCASMATEMAETPKWLKTSAACVMATRMAEIVGGMCDGDQNG